MADSDSEEDYGFIRPSLNRMLRSILDQYPDDGQILKELIQNAEDAGAKVVKLVYDDSKYPTNSLHHPDMAQFQGPALFAYNDATFEEKDWKGIRMLQESIKEKDPMKVGRFGLGFKSVFHMTDFPSVLSKDRLYMIDPHEKFFHHKGQCTSGYTWHLQKKKEAMQQIPDQFSPYKHILDCNAETFEKAYYDGTLFRFPLRQNESELSDTIYDAPKMQDLLESFKKEAQLLLLFLKNLEQIQVYHRKDGVLEKVFEVIIAENGIDNVRQGRQNSRQCCMESMSAHPDGVDISYKITIETIKYENSEVTERQSKSWLVSEHKAGTQTTPILLKLSHDKSLSLVPLVGVAMELNHQNQQDTNPNGQVFCSLPLPIEQKSPTGLPVHVNGYFAISQNRQHLKWSTTSMSRSDKAVQWNLCLLQELLPVAYCNLLHEAVNNRFSPNAVYKSIPDEKIVDTKWTIMLPQLYKKIYELPIIHTPNRGGQWLKAGNVIFEDEKQPLGDVLRNSLLRCDMNLALIPQHIATSLEKYFGKVILLSPPRVRDQLKQNKGSYSDRCTSEKLHILQYVLLDGNYDQLHGLELLPCADGNMVEFKHMSHSTQHIWIPDCTATRDLFPSLESSLLADNLPQDILQQLADVAKEAKYQLCCMEKEAVTSLIKMVIPKEWFSQSTVTVDPDCPVTSEWLEKLWTYLSRDFPEDLQMFEGLHLIPDVNNSCEPLKLLPLNVDCHVLRQSKGVCLNKDIESILQLSRINVLQSIPPYVEKHPLVNGHYVRFPYDTEIIGLLNASYVKYGATIITEIDQKTPVPARMALVELITRLENIDHSTQEILWKLPIFPSTRVTDEKIQYVSVESSPEGTDLCAIPCKVSKIFIDISSSTVCSAARKLNVSILSSKDIMQNYVLEEMKKGTFDVNDIHRIMATIFHDFNKFDDKQFCAMLKNVRFVICNNDPDACLKMPCELFNPGDDLLQHMFEGEIEKFPLGKYSEPQMLLHLEKMGLKSVNDVSASNIWECAKRVKQQPKDKKVKKSHALLSILSNHPHLLQEMVFIESKKQKLVDCVKTLSWVPLMDKPPNYPQSLSWNSTGVSETTGEPCKVKPARFHKLVGSVCGIIDGEVSEKLMDMFGWNECKDLDLVCKQAAHIIQSYEPEHKALYLDLICQVYDFMGHIAEADGAEIAKDALRRQNIVNWIWHGNGFTSINSIFGEKPAIDMTPHIYTLSPEMLCRKNLFHQFGMETTCDVKRTITVLQQIAYQLRNAKDVVHNLQLAVEILNWLKEHISSLSEEERSEILLPVESEQGSSKVEMIPIKECVYCDEEWFKQDAIKISDMSIRLIHSNVPMATAAQLGVPSLMSKILPSIDLPFTTFGQGEPLTSRIKTLLGDYEDGLTIFKEMIQNADDAGATEIKFMYDERLNKEYMTRLVDAGMRECQGPALWVYNNAAFTDQDFDNIAKLGGATKADDPTKIGKFGLGFNAVYNLTDVPSFISKNTLVIFDPHARYLGKTIKDKGQPGIRVDLKKCEDFISVISDQLEPYSGIFGYNMEGTDFSGTLFRLPLRTRHQAQCSDLCPIEYGKKRMIELIQLLVKHVHDMLIFTQHVSKMSLHFLQDGTTLTDAVEMFCLEKTGRLLSGEDCLNHHRSFIETASEYMQHLEQEGDEIPIQTMLTMTDCKYSSQNEFGLVYTEPTQHWLVTECIGSGQSLQLSQDMEKAFLPIGGVAINLEETESGLIPRRIYKQSSSSGTRGLAYSFLPLPIDTGMGVHINGAFAVESNRKHICERNTDLIDGKGAKWNDALLSDAVVRAYLRNLELLKEIHPPDGTFDCYTMWPTFDTSQVFQPVVTGFYQDLSILMNLPFISDGGTIIPLTNIIFLDIPEVVADQAHCVMNEVMDGYQVIKPITDVIDCLRKVGHDAFIEERYYSIHRFYKDIFFPNITGLEKSVREQLVIYALEADQKDLDELLVKFECIPTTKKRTPLKKICDTVHPNKQAAKLYGPEDAKFPYGKQFNEDKVQRRLTDLGMKTDDVPWEDLVERAQSVKTAMEVGEKKGTLRLECVLNFLNKKLNPSLTEPEWSETQDKIRDKLKQTAFLQVMPKPNDWPLMWAGDSANRKDLFMPEELYDTKVKELLSSTEMIVDDHKLSHETKFFLGLAEKPISAEQVAQQSEQILTIDVKHLNDEEYSKTQNIIHQLYGWLQKNLNQQELLPDPVAKVFETYPSILIDRQFVPPSHLAFAHSENCLPFLGILPDVLRTQFCDVMNNLGVKHQFEIEDYIGALQRAKHQFGNEALQKEDLSIVVRIVSLLNKAMETAKEDCEMIQEKRKGEEIYIPNKDGVLHSSTTLCYDDCPWVSSRNMSFVHRDITYDCSARLGVRTKIQQKVGDHAKGIPFGQKETLTNSLRRILRNSSCDVEILKELIQNADDAAATDIHFILDTRQHSAERLFSDSWKSLQGPSLLVYNNRPFTMNDLESIQKLGEGSKQDDPSTTGQYGIGFSSVYHLTDVPSILTHIPETGKTLCVFDPQCKYVPNATEAEPGMRYENISDLEKNFPDVFGCYLQDQFDMKSGTMFRIPLRTEAPSKISFENITHEKVRELLDELECKLHDMLLFTNHLQEIKISDIDLKTGKLNTTYNMKLEIDETAQQCRSDIAKEVKHYSGIVKEQIIKVQKGDVQVDDMSLLNIPHKQFIYQLGVKDNKGSETWCICQSTGLIEGTQIPESVTDAFQKGKLALMLRGGAAWHLKNCKNDQSPNIYCFLPLREESGIPVHINGHFAISHESRWNVWHKHETSGYRKDWNDLLCKTVIAESYVNLLYRLKDRTDGDLKHLSAQETSQDGKSLLDGFMNLLPNMESANENWHNLVVSVYNVAQLKNVKIFPVIREISPISDKENEFTVGWFPATGVAHEKVYFSHVEPREKQQKPKSKKNKMELEDILMECGMKIVKIPECIEKTLRNITITTITDGAEQKGNTEEQGCNHSISFVEPDTVMDFLKTCKNENSLCLLTDLPKPLEETKLKARNVSGKKETQLNAQNFMVVFNYCLQKKSSIDQLEGLPLLLTQDGKLRKFQEAAPVFPPQPSSHILCKQNDLVIDNAQWNAIKGSIPSPDPGCKEKNHIAKFIEQSNVFRTLTITHFEKLLPGELPSEMVKGDRVSWDEITPKPEWIHHLWSFLTNETSFNKKDPKEEINIPHIKNLLRTVENNALIPARITQTISDNGKKTTKHSSCLFPIVKAQEMIQKVRYSITDDDEVSKASAQDTLIKIGIPCLDVTALYSKYSIFPLKKSDDAAIPNCLVPTMDNASAVLDILLQHFAQERAPLSCEEAYVILRYFFQNLDLEDGNRMKSMRDLPLFTNVSGKVISLNSCEAYIIPPDVPTDGIELWTRKQGGAGILLLQEQEFDNEFYSKLGCDHLSIVDLYCKFIFKHFELLDDEGQHNQMVHLHFLYENILKRVDELKVDEKYLVENLKQLAFLKVGEDNFQTASMFFDKDVELFQLMCPQDKLTPSFPGPFTEREWKRFMHIAGIVTRDMNEELFVKFAREIETIACCMGYSEALQISTLLTGLLFEMESGPIRDILCAISEIKYIVVKPDEKLSKIHPFCDSTNHLIAFKGSASYENRHIIWTQIPVLPKWADPTQHVPKNWANWLGVLTDVPSGLVAENLVAVCKRMTKDTSENLMYIQDVSSVIKKMYAHLNRKAIEDWNIQSILNEEHVVLVKDVTTLTKAKQTTVGISASEEIHPYLYKIPIHLGEYVPLFKFLGCTDVPSMEQYLQVIEKIKSEIEESPLNPNELNALCKALKGLFQVMGEGYRPSDIARLFLLDEKRCLKNIMSLVYNDAPAYYHRLSGQRFPFAVDLLNFGLNGSSAIKFLRELPKVARPKFLSDLVKEQLLPERDIHKAPVTFLEQRFRSKAFMTACQRLICHEAHAAGKQICETEAADAIRCLSLTEVSSLSQLKTHLLIGDKIIDGSETEKVCFSEQIKRTYGISQWHLYIRCEDTHNTLCHDTLSQDLLIPLSETINDILGHRLQNSVIYLPLLLTCAESEMQRKLDQQNIMIDGEQSSSSIPFLPNPGDLLQDHDWLHMSGEHTNFDVGEYVGVESKGRGKMLYGLVKKEVPVAGDEKVYEICIGNRLVRQLSVNKIYKFIRC